MFLEVLIDWWVCQVGAKLCRKVALQEQASMNVVLLACLKEVKTFAFRSIFMHLQLQFYFSHLNRFKQTCSAGGSRNVFENHCISGWMDVMLKTQETWTEINKPDIRIGHHFGIPQYGNTNLNHQLTSNLTGSQTSHDQTAWHLAFVSLYLM